MILTAIRIFLSGCATLAVSLVALAYLPFLRTGRTFHVMVRTWAKVVLKIFGIKVHVMGAENLSPGQHYIYAANHASMFDIPTVIANIPDDVHIVFKKELTHVPIWGWALRFSPYIMIDRKKTRDAMQSLNEAAAKIHAGKSVLLFVEGTRTRDGKLQPFKRGAFSLAAKSGIPMIPLTINHTFRIMPKGSLKVEVRDISIVLDTPVPTKGVEGKEGEQVLMDKVERAIGRNYIVPE